MFNFQGVPFILTFFNNVQSAQKKMAIKKTIKRISTESKLKKPGISRGRGDSALDALHGSIPIKQEGSQSSIQNQSLYIKNFWL